MEGASAPRNNGQSSKLDYKQKKATAQKSQTPKAPVSGDKSMAVRAKPWK